MCMDIFTYWKVSTYTIYCTLCCLWFVTSSHFHAEGHQMTRGNKVDESAYSRQSTGSLLFTRPLISSQCHKSLPLLYHLPEPILLLHLCGYIATVIARKGAFILFLSAVFFFLLCFYFAFIVSCPLAHRPSFMICSTYFYSLLHADCIMVPHWWKRAVHCSVVHMASSSAALQKFTMTISDVFTKIKPESESLGRYAISHVVLLA